VVSDRQTMTINYDQTLLNASERHQGGGGLVLMSRPDIH
jgi:hypothetical protein